MTDIERAEVWRQERPLWCPHTDCLFRRRVQDAICGGELPSPEPHDSDRNTHRICVNTRDTEADPVFGLQVNRTDLDWFRWVFDALDGRDTSWLAPQRRTVTQPPEEGK